VAQLTEQASPQTAASIPAATQLIAVAWLRWRIFANGFRRSQTGARNAGSLVLTILLRLFLWPIFAMMAIGPAIGAGFFAYSTVSQHHGQALAPMLAGVVLLWQFIAINGVGMAAAAPASTFDQSSLLRFPLQFPRYLVLRLLLGLLTPSTIIGCLALFAAAVGIAVADPSLALAAFIVLAIYAAMNIFLTRTLAAWMERWLASRRAREFFGVLMGLLFVTFEAFNMHIGKHASHASSWLLTLLHSSSRFFAWLPPGFASAAILQTGHPLARLAQFAALVASTALIFFAFAIRLRKQFLGEYLSEGAPRAAVSTPAARLAAPQPPRALAPTASSQQEPASLLSPAVAACLRKEWIYLTNSGAQLIRMLTPLIFVYIFSHGIFARHPSYLISGAVGYVLIAPLATLYNIFGADGPGVQLYLLSPAPLRDVVLAKNIASLALMIVHAALAWCLVLFVTTVPIPLPVELSSALWIVFFLFLNLTLGTLRSIQSPRKAIVPGQAPRLRNPSANRTSSLLVLATFFGSFLLLIPVNLLARHLHSPWLAAVILFPLAAAAIAAYAAMLRHIDRLILKHRDRLAEELCGS
jgi:ABC-2 type transport system permease protein